MPLLVGHGFGFDEFGLLELDVGETAGNDFAKHFGLFGRREQSSRVSCANSRPIRSSRIQRTAHSMVPFSPR